MCIKGHYSETAEALLREWTKGESLIKHGLAVAACTESYGVREAARLGLRGPGAAQLADRYRAAGLLHDLDYERHPSPDQHPFVGVAYPARGGLAGGDPARHPRACRLHRCRTRDAS